MAVKYLVGNEEWSDIGQTSQVYKLTHDGEGNRLPYRTKTYISFSFGGKFIEDFDLIVVNGGDRMERQIYSNFSDNVTSNDTRDGQIFWGATQTTNQLELTLATDEMSEQDLDNFREWFAPGKTRELIMSEHPNRAIMARVSDTPQYSFIPFEKIETYKVNLNTYNVSTTVFRGEIKLNFVMDDPNWYAKLNYMPTYINRITLEELSVNSNNSNKVATDAYEDTLKIMYEDGIPHQSMINGTFFLGGNYLVTEEARVGAAQINHSYIGIITAESTGLTVNPSTSQYLFYCGTAKCYPTIKFSILPQFSNYYISHPINNFVENAQDYSTFQIGTQVFKFTTPSILTGYNQAIQLFNNALNKSAATLNAEIRDKIMNRYARAWAVGCISALGNVTTITSANISTLKTNMNSFISTSTPMTFTFNSKTGEATGSFSIKVLQTATDTISNVDYQTKVENVGDMVCSDYLTIEGRNYLNSEGEIVPENCHIITSNESLTDVLVFYQNMYL